MEQIPTVKQKQHKQMTDKGKKEIGQLCAIPRIIRIVTAPMLFPLRHGLLRVSEKQGTSSLHQST